MTSDVDKTFNIIQPYGGRQTRFFRFPGPCRCLRERNPQPAPLSEVRAAR